ncbi:MAG: hypothetical protein CK532_03945 [Flavobacteriales bacterium]|nr:MAG: hypothetical protein CK532_03945 [Flavobacteriales bacterium]
MLLQFNLNNQKRVQSIQVRVVSFKKFITVYQPDHGAIYTYSFWSFTKGIFLINFKPLAL